MTGPEPAGTRTETEAGLGPPDAGGEFMLVIRRPTAAPPPSEGAGVLERYFEWFDALEARGVLVGRRALSKGGDLVQLVDGAVVDGPFTESKEVVMGVVILRGLDREGARAVARSCPGLALGDAVEVRAIHDVRGQR